MRILHLITRLIVGGAQENTLLSCAGQHEFGHEVTLITGPAIGPEGSLMDRARSAGYRIQIVDDMRRAIHPARDYRTFQKLTAIIKKLQPDIVHTHSSKAGIIGRWAARSAAISLQKSGRRRPGIIHTIHGLAFTASTRALVNKAYEFLERRTAPITDRIVCVATAMADQSRAARIGRAAQYTTVYSGMETAPFLHPPIPREQVRRELDIGPDDIIVGTIARLFHLKGHDDLLDMAPALCARFPKLRFMWVGDGLLRPQFENRIHQMNLSSRFILTGLVPPTQIPQLVSAMDILIHPSRREGLARALAQGGLAAIPVVTYDVDGNREGLLDGQSGFLIPPFNQSMLAERLAFLLDNPQLRRQMGQTGRTFALARFDSNVMVAALEKVYASVVSAIH